MSLEGILLGILRRPSSGYEVKRAFDTIFRHIWTAELSQIYRTLKTLERRGELRSRAERSAKGPAKRVYEITAKGRKRLHAWLAQPPPQQDERHAEVAQLYFLGELQDWRRTAAFLEELARRYGQRHATLSAMAAEWRTADPNCPDRLAHEAFHSWLTLQMGVQRSEALARWAQDYLKRVKTRSTEK